MLRTTALELLWIRRRFRAKSIPRAPALHPIPEMLKLFTSLLMPYLLTTVEASEGTGQNPLQFTIRMSISRGDVLVLLRRSSMTGNRTISASLMDSRYAVLGGI